MSSEATPWMCHVCGMKSNLGEGQSCAECYKVTCSQHLTMVTALNHDSGLYEIKRVCVECQLEQQLS